MILVTGGAGFIGANFVLDWLAQSDEPVINLDKLTYAGNMENLAAIADDPRHIFAQGDIGDSVLVTQLLQTHQPRAVINSVIQHAHEFMECKKTALPVKERKLAKQSFGRAKGKLTKLAKALKMDDKG